MAKIQARNIDDALFERITQSAMRNERSVEGEIRLALAAAYPPSSQLNSPALSMRERWVQETGQRLQWLFERLMADRFFPSLGYRTTLDTTAVIYLARTLEQPPEKLMDLVEGLIPMPLALADRIADMTGGGADWLLTGSGSPFPVRQLTMRDIYEFFDTETPGRYVYDLLRVNAGPSEGTLLIVRTETETGQKTVGAVTEVFSLSSGMGHTGHGNLREFLLFLKTTGSSLTLNTYNFTPPADEALWSVVGYHHPAWLRNGNLCDSARWLQQLFSGEDPGGWFTGWGTDLETIRSTPLGSSAPGR